MAKWQHYFIFFICTLLYCGQVAFASDECNLQFKINGINDPLLSNSLTRLNILRDSRGCSLSIRKIHSIYNKAPKEIEQALEPYGYFSPVINGRLIQIDNSWQAQLTVQKGPATHVRQIRIELAGPGKQNKKLRDYLAHLPIKVGDVFNVTTYDEVREKLYQTAALAGYPKARFAKNSITIDKEQRTATIYLQLQTNHRYYYGHVTFNHSVYAESFLYRFLNFKEGDPFSDQALIDLQEAMASTFYFTRVSISPDLAHANNYHVPINIDVEAPHSQGYRAGIGYGTFTGPRLTLGISFRRVTDTGQHADLSLRLSNVLTSLTAKYFIPGSNPLTDSWVGGATYQKFSPKNGESESSTLFLGSIRQLDDWTSTLYLNYLSERYTVINTPTRNSNLLYPSWTLSYLQTDNLIDPTRGLAFSVNFQGASERLFSITNYAQTDIKSKWLISPFSFARIILRGEFGYTVVNDLYKLPLTLQFTTGGPTTIRGFEDSSIGPGKYLGIASLEYRNQIVGDWFGAVFYDTGTATNHFGKAADNANAPLNTGVGVGIIYQSMVGPIKLYFAEAISKNKRPKSIEFSIGPEF